MNSLDQKKLYLNLGKKIRFIRNQMGLNQEEFGLLFDLTRPSIVNIELGRQRPSLHLLYDIALKTNTEVQDLVLDLLPNEAPKREIDVLKEISKKDILNEESITKISDFLKNELR